jgi:hypothetical protein
MFSQESAARLTPKDTPVIETFRHSVGPLDADGDHHPAHEFSSGSPGGNAHGDAYG